NPESADSSDVLLIGGMPLNQPIAHYGPFVMNTHEEIDQAEPKFALVKAYSLLK
ncbi:MAG: pirin-like C-terminal cupin domain-containing protein, partial [Candidatus Nitrosopolaris sp.]